MQSYVARVRIDNPRTERVLRNPFRLLGYGRDETYALWLRTRPNIHCHGRIRIRGLPIIDIEKGCVLDIGSNVVLNSRNRGYHINMHSPVKLFADWPGAAIRIGSNTRIHGSCIHAYDSVVIGCNVLIAANCQIFDGSGHDLSFPDVESRIHTKGTAQPIRIADNVWIGANCFVLPGASIGNGSVIAAGSVVTTAIPPMVLAGGSPARVIREHSRLSEPG